MAGAAGWTRRASRAPGSDPEWLEDGALGLEWLVDCMGRLESAASKRLCLRSSKEHAAKALHVDLWPMGLSFCELWQSSKPRSRWRYKAVTETISVF